MKLSIKRIDQDNHRQISQMSVAPEQAHFIETVEACLDEAAQEVAWRPVGIYDADVAIGFAMYGLLKEEEERVWLDRFLITQEQQGKGYAKPCVELLIEQLLKEYGCNLIYLSVYEDNKIAISLYKKLGFEFNGELDTLGEKVMVKRILHLEESHG